MKFFAVVEGIEGCGKSTLIKALETELSKHQLQFVTTLEPGGTEIGKRIRQILLDKNNSKLASKSEMFLFAADRAQHISEVLLPALQQKRIVLCDRYYHSTLAYQGYGRGLDLNELRNIIQIATSGLQPDIVFLLDLAPEVGLSRAKQRTAEISRKQDSSLSWSRFEEAELGFHRKVREGFLKLAELEKDKFYVLKAEMTAQEVAQEACKVLLKRISEAH